MCMKAQLSGEAAKIRALVILFPNASCGSPAGSDLPQRAPGCGPEERDGVQPWGEPGAMACGHC